MGDVVVERALYRRERGEEPRLLARSGGLAEQLFGPLREILVGFGEPPPGQSAAGALFAQPVGEDCVAVVRVLEGAPGPNGWAALEFDSLILPVRGYEAFGGDPFGLSRKIPTAPKDAISSAPITCEAVTLPAEPLAALGVEAVRAVLKRVKAHALVENADPHSPPPLTVENAESPTLLGGVQALVDGGKLAFERPRPDASVVEALWTLLPYRLRPQLWPATFAFANDLGFDVLVTPRLEALELEGYTTETQAGDYPQGSYELALQTAAEAGDPRELDAVFQRRTSNDTVWLGVKLLVGLCLILVVTRLIPMSPPPPPDLAERAATVASIVGLSRNAIGMHDPFPAIEAVERGSRIYLKR